MKLVAHVDTRAMVQQFSGCICVAGAMRAGAAQKGEVSIDVTCLRERGSRLPRVLLIRRCCSRRAVHRAAAARER